MNKTYKRFFGCLAALVAVFALVGGLMLSGCSAGTTSRSGQSSAQVSQSASAHVDSSDTSYAQEHLDSTEYDPPDIRISENGEYTDKDSVALYIHTYGHLPSNYISKTKARKAGWVNTDGNLWDVLPGKSIGGGTFYNDDNMMPDAYGRQWYECDIDYDGGFRNAKRLVYSNDGLIYYTDDHYKTFQRLY